MAQGQSQSRPARRQRADAERSIEAILDAALELLAERPDVSIGEIASRAGVTRQTVYAHFDSREALLGAVAERALAESVAAIDAVDPQAGEPAAALERLVRAWWATVARHARVLGTLATAYPDPSSIHSLHAPILERLERLIRRGQRAGDFDRSLPPRWLAAAFFALMHAAADEVAADHLDERAAARALEASIPRVFGHGL